MFLVDKPYLSEFFKKTIRDHGIPVVDTEIARQLGLYPGTKLISEEQAIEMAGQQDDLRIYTTSENAIGWLAKHFPVSDLPGKIDIFKNKLKFRELTKTLFPGFYFHGVRVSELRQVQFDQLPLPFIIKPAVGFFSMGVHKVSSYEEWLVACSAIIAELAQGRNLYPEEVLDTGTFIIEQCINGDEFAIDAYFDADGEPVILGIFQHPFSSNSDVSDRVYISSKEIIESNLAEFTDFIGKIGRLAGLKNFPVHVELRRDIDGALLPIEVNPMRFGGWCTTADLTFLAYGLNPYLYYFLGTKPNWPAVLRRKDEKIFSIVILDNSTGVDEKAINAFDYDKLLARFEHPIELRKIDYRHYPIFGFLFAETRAANFAELENILASDLKEFISCHNTEG
ncbi:MAG: ATP-grasp domain-containing protein [Desulfobulbaceae bacterium]|nr:ATP-grasp domain-containing protein [Desulfobulbaceae bacterium]HIJ78913.1 ATP-grasp domain-containing protein [Deltaproteobacteria bacterium]